MNHAMSVAHEDQTSKEVNSDFKALRIRRLGEGPSAVVSEGTFKEYNDPEHPEVVSANQAPRKSKMGGPPRPTNGMPPKAGSNTKPLRPNPSSHLSQ